MILDEYGHAVRAGIERGALGNGPGLESALHLQREVVVQTGLLGVVPLDAELKRAGGRLGRGRRGFRRLGESSLFGVILERHKIESSYSMIVAGDEKEEPVWLRRYGKGI